MHLEYVVVGIPISNQSTGSLALQTWRTAVEAEAKKNWTGVPLTGKLKAVIINFHTGDKPSVDLDNMSKPILDVMQQIV
jgi:Holliday junction resolvase RusA-like endonuclease